MPKPNSSHTLPQLKHYVRTHKLNKGVVPLSLNKSEMIKRLKSAGHWDHGTAKKPAEEKKMSVRDRVKKIEAKKAKKKPKKKDKTTLGTGAEGTKYLGGDSYDISGRTGWSW